MPKIKIIEGYLVDILKSYPTAKHLHLSEEEMGDDGWMSEFETLIAAGLEPYCYSDPNDVAYCFLALNSRNTPVGMALVWDEYCENDLRSFGVYIKPNYRRKGIGKMLFERARNKFGDENLETHPWDDRSELFFKSVE